MKIQILFALVLISVSCQNNSNLVEVEIPEPEEEVITKFANPKNIKAQGKPFSLYEFPYEFDDFEPFINGRTMENHYAKTYRNYANNLNILVTQHNLEGKTISQICKELKEDGDPALRNNAGGFYNHGLFFQILTPKTTGKPSPELETALTETFGSMAGFEADFTEKASQTFGSNWVWLIVNKDKKLEITITLNENNPLMPDAEVKGIPLLCFDLWEHAYIQNSMSSRKEYIYRFFSHLDWERINTNFTKAIK